MIYTCKTEEKFQVLEGHLAKHYEKSTLLMHTWWRGGSIVVVKRALSVGGSFFLKDNSVVYLADQRGKVGYFPVEKKDAAMLILSVSNLTNCNKLFCKCYVIF